MSADTYECRKCGALVITTHREHHEANRCKELQQLARKRTYNAERMRKKRRGLPTKRGKPTNCALPECGAEFLSQGVTHRYCCPRPADVARMGEEADDGDEARHEAEMEPIRRKDAVTLAEAEAVPMRSETDSHALWLRCLGVAG